MRRLTLALVLVAAGFILTAFPAAAQGTQGFQLGLKGGVSIPNGTTSDAFDNGYHGGIVFHYKIPALPLALRLDGDYDHFLAKGGVSGNAEIFDGTLDLVLGFKILAVKPYVLGGVGLYGAKIEAEVAGVSASTNQTKSGWNAGAGIALTLGKNSIFAEARYHEISLDATKFKYTPVSLGILF